MRHFSQKEVEPNLLTYLLLLIALFLYVPQDGSAIDSTQLAISNDVPVMAAIALIYTNQVQIQNGRAEHQESEFVLKHLAESGRILLDLSAYIPRHSSYLSFLGIALEN